MDSYFDHVAEGYDKEFTYTEIGKKQRRIVYDFLSDKLELCQNVFEVNCGTGEDAIWIAEKGKNVLATDISNEMIQVANRKIATKDNPLNVRFEVLDFKKMDQFAIEKEYDLVFSDFGGLNCLSPIELARFLKSVKEKVLLPNGRLVLIIMSKASIWEWLFFLRKLNFRKAFRRNTNKALEVNVNGKMVPTYYYNPSFFRSLKDDFEITSLQTVGFFLPPSYLEPVFSKMPKLLNFLSELEYRVKNTKMLAAFSDHYLIELKPR